MLTERSCFTHCSLRDFVLIVTSLKLKGATSRSRMRARSRKSLKVLASNFQSRRRGRIRNFIEKYLCHP